MMTQDDLVTLLGLTCSLPPFDFSSVTEDSRRVRAGALFIAVPGEKADGHAFAEDAVNAGASAVLGNKAGVEQVNGRPYIYFEHPRRAAGILAHALYGTPSRQQYVIGVTGTNGKTSTACLIQSILNAAGKPCANFGTLGYDLGGMWADASHTTPFGEELASLFAQAAGKGLRHVVMEVSSHALDQDRVAGIDFNVAAFTNLTQDHLDYHQNMDAYREAKGILFSKVCESLSAASPQEPRFGVVNVEDSSAQYFIGILPDNCLTYGQGGQVRANAVQTRTEASAFDLVSPWGAAPVRMHLVGRHNILNALCAATVAGGMGIPLETIVAGIEALQCVPGRFEPVSAGQPFQVIVDYAHTDDGLRNALMAARAVCKGRVLVVFGCGGDRDKGKRPKMGAVAAELADFCVVTSDNPRTEDPLRILMDIEVGLQHTGKRKAEDYCVIESRRDAIRHAIELARPDDLVLIAGKGHEDYQILGTTRHHFDDREEALHALRSSS